VNLKSVFYTRLNAGGQAEAHALEGSEPMNIRADRESSLSKRDWCGPSHMLARLGDKRWEVDIRTCSFMTCRSSMYCLLNRASLLHFLQIPLRLLPIFDIFGGGFVIN